MTARAAVLRQHGNAYNIFILVLTLFSFVLMGLLLLPLDDDTQILVMVYDNAICVIFLADFVWSLSGSRPRRAYFIHARGWLDLLGPSRASASSSSRLCCASRGSAGWRASGACSAAGIARRSSPTCSPTGARHHVITILAAGIVLSVASILIVQFESKSPDANIHTGWDALWWGVVTLTTVGYGDQYPVTVLGHFTAASVMFAGVGIIGGLASVLASLLVPRRRPTHRRRSPRRRARGQSPTWGAGRGLGRVAAAGRAVAGPGAGGGGATRSHPGGRTATGGLAPAVIADELAQLRAEIAALRAALPPGSG